jgi:hypothetical protein
VRGEDARGLRVIHCWRDGRETAGWIGVDLVGCGSVMESDGEHGRGGGAKRGLEDASRRAPRRHVMYDPAKRMPGLGWCPRYRLETVWRSDGIE